MTFKRPVLYIHWYDSPVGSLFLAVDRKGGAVRVGSAMDQSLEKRYDIQPNAYACGELAFQLDAYFRGELTKFTIETVLEGTEFQLSVWNRILKIPYGTVMGYSEIAQKVGRKNAARSVGNAVAQNRLAILVPCHRVVGARGSIGQYSIRSPQDELGTKAKAYLLSLEEHAAERELSAAGPKR